jgi:hypothetical protein
MDAYVTERGRGEYECKSIGIRDGTGTRTDVLLTKLNGEGHKVLGEQGFHGEYILFTVLRPGEMVTDYDYYRLKISAAGVVGNQKAQDLLSAVHSYKVSWDELEDGKVYDPVEVVDMTREADD